MLNCDSAVAGFDTDIDVPGAGNKKVYLNGKEIEVLEWKIKR